MLFQLSLTFHIICIIYLTEPAVDWVQGLIYDVLYTNKVVIAGKGGRPYTPALPQGTKIAQSVQQPGNSLQEEPHLKIDLHHSQI